MQPDLDGDILPEAEDPGPLRGSGFRLCEQTEGTIGPPDLHLKSLLP